MYNAITSEKFSEAKKKNKTHAPCVTDSTEGCLGQSLKVETHTCIPTAEETAMCPSHNTKGKSCHRSRREIRAEGGL